jgi:RNA polymerase sigma-70 factor (ECF subfamily)
MLVAMVASLGVLLRPALVRTAAGPSAGGPRVLDALIKRAQAGDAAALEALLKRHAPDVTRIAHRLLGPSADLEDVVQEALFQIARALPRFEQRSKLSTWLYRVVANVVRMHLRHKAARPALELTEPSQIDQRVVLSATPEQHAQQSEDLRALYRRLDALSEKKRSVLVLHDLEGLPAAEIAEVLEIPLLTVRTRLFYARKELYAALAAEPELAHLDPLADSHAAGVAREPYAPVAKGKRS